MWWLKGRMFGTAESSSNDRRPGGAAGRGGIDENDRSVPYVGGGGNSGNNQYRRQTTSMMGARQSTTTTHHDTFQGFMILEKRMNGDTSEEWKTDEEEEMMSTDGDAFGDSSYTSSEGSVSPSSEACSSSGSTNYSSSRANVSASAPSASSSGRTATRERKPAGSSRSSGMRSLSPAHPNAVMSGMDDFLRPERFDRLMQMHPPEKHIQEQHSWNPEDRSLNIFVKDEDKFTFHRHPVAQSTDCIRGKIGYSRGFHVWQIEWPERQRGTHAVVGVATKNAPLHATGYTALIGTANDSYGWDITRRECHHDSKHTMTWRYPNNVRDMYHVPDKFYCILDMDEGYMAFATDEEYLGVAFRNLKGKTLYPIVAAVWGHCEISMRYLGSLEPEPLSLSEMCRRRLRIEMGETAADQIEQLAIPPIMKKYLMYQC